MNQSHEQSRLQLEENGRGDAFQRFYEVSNEKRTHGLRPSKAQNSSITFEDDDVHQIAILGQGRGSNVEKER